MFNITWWTHSTIVLAWGFLTDIKTDLMSNSFSKGVKSRLNSDPLPNTTFRGCGYLHSHVLLNIWITLADYLSMYSSLPAVASSRSNIGISTTSNQPVTGSIIVIQVRLSSFCMIAPPGFCCLVDLLYVPIRSTFTKSHGCSSLIFLCGICL